MYELAKNYGYASKPSKGQEAGKKLETIERGQEASKSLGSGSRADPGKLTLDALARMDDEDFNNLVTDEKKWKEIGSLMH